MKNFAFLSILTLFAFGCTSSSPELVGTPVKETPEPVVVEEEGAKYLNEEFGFSVDFPEDELVLENNALWTNEGLKFKDQPGSAVEAFVTIEAEELMEMTLEEFVIADHSFGEFKKLEEVDFIAGENSPGDYEYETINGRTVLRVYVPEFYQVTEYYVVQDGIVVSFRTFSSLGAEETLILEEMISSLTFI